LRRSFLGFLPILLNRKLRQMNLFLKLQIGTKCFLSIGFIQSPREWRQGVGFVSARFRRKAEEHYGTTKSGTEKQRWWRDTDQPS
jgi:hypothetical protein